ncbi:phage (Mu-like) virion morphogenesis protein [Sulfuriferula multivorans]|uniref:Phage (Mu-like) virion morphogenesis protein n=1 Tax=Sulfuriferula multivorans TaxID=1559896 RepID=A0A401JF64_9PROT|nr:phage minor head protein [Sulfuriferula multivorans]GBL46272.1 phage (Mu-like) virion morphogenesis protein [Sulfuriferula multivorans]
MDSIGYDPRLPFTEQIAFFLGKSTNLIPTKRWTDLLKAQHDRAFMVAGAMKADLLADLYEAVEQAIGLGTGIGEFRKAFDATVQKNGWDYTGERNWRTRVIYQTNISTSYAAGRLVQLKDGGFKYWMYKHSDSVMHPRPLHLSWNGITLPAGDAWWKTHYPPNGWGCQCRIIGVRNAAGAKRLGGNIVDTAPDDGVVPGTDRPKGIDLGWDYQPGATVVDDLRKQLSSRLASLPAQIADALKKDLQGPSK